MNQLGDAVAVKKSATQPVRPPRFGSWQPLFLAVLIGSLYYKILGALVLDWWYDPNFSHGFFVPLFSGFLVWERRKRLAILPRQPSWLGLVVIGGALCTLVIGLFGAELFLSRSSLLLLLAGLVICFWGWPYLLALFPAWAFLFLMIPIPAIIFNHVTLPLQLLASQFASSALQLLHVPVLCQGNVIQLPSMPLEVAEACSGIRSLMSLGTLAIIYGYFLETGVFRRVLLVLAAIPIAIAANATRIVGTGLLVQYWDPDRALGFFHEFSGWVVFMVSLGMLFLVHCALECITRASRRTS